MGFSLNGDSGNKILQRKRYKLWLWLEADFQKQLFGFLDVTSKFMMETVALVIYIDPNRSVIVYRVLKKSPWAIIEYNSPWLSIGKQELKENWTTHNDKHMP